MEPSPCRLASHPHPLADIVGSDQRCDKEPAAETSRTDQDLAHNIQRLPGALGAWISPINKMLSMWVCRTSARCRVVEALGNGRRAWSAVDYRVPAPWRYSQHEYGERPGRRPTQMPRPQAGTKGRGWRTVSAALVTAVRYAGSRCEAAPEGPLLPGEVPDGA